MLRTYFTTTTRVITKFSIAHWGIGTHTLIKHSIFPNCHLYTLCDMYTDHLFINVISEIDAALNICCRTFAWNIKLPLREKKKDGFLGT